MRKRQDRSCFIIIIIEMRSWIKNADIKQIITKIEPTVRHFSNNLLMCCQSEMLICVSDGKKAQIKITFSLYLIPSKIFSIPTKAMVSFSL